MPTSTRPTTPSPSAPGSTAALQILAGGVATLAVHDPQIFSFN
ncbi:hypothetical protein ACP70R_018787 [Stipagrostis hirtigluma subsp. patula]